jgi:hypothetical protein
MLKAIAILTMTAGAAAAHETHTGWAYPPHCCSNRDCSEIDAIRVRVTPNGYVVDGVHLVYFRDALRSPDSQYHACYLRAWAAPRCFFAPPGLM